MRWILRGCPARSFATCLILAALAAQPLVAATVTVTADAGPGSLREAIDEANSDGVPTTISFAAGLAGQTIVLASALPGLTEPDTTIDGDLGGDCVPDIAIDGQEMPGANGLWIASDGNRVRGLAIHSFDCPGCGGDLIVLGADGNTIECNYLGTDLSGTNPLGTQTYGIKLVNGSDGNVIRDNHIVFNGTGVGLFGGSSGNVIGPDNLIAFGGTAVHVQEDSLPGYPDFTGLTADSAGVFPVIDFTDGCGYFRSSDSITPLDGGGRPFTENFGMRLSGTLSVGTGGTYSFELPGLDDLARLTVAGEVLVDWAGGGTPPPAAKLLTGGDHAIELDFFEGGGAATVALVVSGPGPVSYNTNGQSVCATGEAGLCGELFQLRQPAEQNRITQNSMHSNGGLGIRLGCCCSPLANDAGDLDLGANTVLNHPGITGVSGAGGGSYIVSGTGPADSTVEVFLSDNDASGFGEGRTFLASTTATPGGAFATGPLSLAPGQAHLTATATDAAGNTSEFGPTFAFGGIQDEMTLGISAPQLPGTVVAVPVRVRDLSLRPLGLDRPAGQRIQAMAFKVGFSPASSVASASAARSGILASLTPLLDDDVATAGSIAYFGAFDEASNPIPFTLDAPPPGDEVVTLALTLAANAPAGSVSLTLDPAVSELSNQAGTLAENQGNGGLALAGASLTVLSNAAAGLYATAQSSAQILLTWADPNANETGFRVERSPDGASWAGVGNTGPNDGSFLDSGLTPAALYYYRLVTLVAAGDSQLSNVATASTFPAAAAKVCATRLSDDRTWARNPSVAFAGAAWATAWQAREDGEQDDIFFRWLGLADAVPISAPVRISDGSASAFGPTVAWNGSRYGVVWNDFLAAEPGGPSAFTYFFSLLDAGANELRGDVRLSSAVETHPFGGRLAPVLLWDGTHWGFFTTEVNAPPRTDLVYRRLEEDGDVVLGPVVLTSTPATHDSDVAVAWSAPESKYGMAWFEIADSTIELYFQRVEESTGAPEDAPVLVGGYTSFVGTFGLSLVWDGAGWAVSWAEPQPDGTVVTFLRRLDSGGTLLGPAVRLSDDPPAEPIDILPLLENKPGGGYAVFTGSFLQVSPFSQEITRLEADAAGDREGNGELMTPADGRPSANHDLASDGSRFLVAFNDAGAGTLETAAFLVDGSGTLPPGTPVQLTSGHSMGNAANFVTAANTSVAPLGAGFVAVWTDAAATGSNQIQAHIFDGAGATVADLAPLTPTPSRGRPGVAAVGSDFALAWRDPANATLYFARFDGNGAPVIGETVVDSTGGAAEVALAWSGEAFGVLRRKGPQLTLLRLTPAGAPMGPETSFAASAAGNPAPRLHWVGSAWVVLYRGVDNNLYFARLDPAGNLAVGPVALTGAVQAEVATQFHSLWTGQHLALAWSEHRGFDPPLTDVYFTLLDMQGARLFPDVLAVGSPAADGSPLLYFAGGRFHLVHAQGRVSGVREVEILAGGTVLAGERFWNHRGGPVAAAHNGVTLGLAWSTNIGDLLFETTECLSDATPPPCPALAATSAGNKVRLSWDPVSDAESGVWRYHLYRDGLPLNELYPATTTFDDGGYAVGSVHGYEVRAINRAWNESDACPALSFSTTTGDANGNGTLEVADVFYLINFLLGDGPPPAGDADANGDGAVTVADIFYLINFFFGGGPPPVWIGEAEVER